MKILSGLFVLILLVEAVPCAAAVGTVKTKWGDAAFVTHVPASKTQVAAVLYALTDDVKDVSRCPIAKLNERGYGVITLDCTKLTGGDKAAAWAAAIKGTKAALKDDEDIDAEAIGVILDKVEPGWDEKEENWMALADAYDRKGWNADPSKVAKTRPFKVMAWNLEGKSETEKELKSLVALLKDVNPDVVLISENYGKLPQIVSMMGGGWSGEAFSMNLAVLSRWPVVKTARPYEAPWNYLDPTGPFNFGLAELTVGGQRVRVCPLWLNFEHGTPRFSTPREEELSGILASVAREIRESDVVPLIIGGDFNGYVDPHEQMMTAAGFVDTYRRFHPDLDGTNVTTWASRDGGKRIFNDYIFAKGEKAVPVSSEIFQAPWHSPFAYRSRDYESFPSDHGFVLTTFELAIPEPPKRSFRSRAGTGALVHYQGVIGEKKGCECVAQGSGVKADEGKVFTFASWNAGHFSLGKRSVSTIADAEGPARAKAYSDFLDEVGADIIGIAEYSEYFTSGSRMQAGGAVFGRYASGVVGPWHDYQWNAQFWKGFAFVTTKTVEYPQHDQRVYYLATRLKVLGEEIVFVETHLDWRTFLPGHENDRKRQMQRIVDDFKDEDCVVIAGDFNIGLRDGKGKTIDNPSEYEVFEKAGFTLGNDGRYKTCPAGMTNDAEQSYALDNVIVKGLDILEFKIFDRPDLSDHALVRARLRIPAKRD